MDAEGGKPAVTRIVVSIVVITVVCWSIVVTDCSEPELCEVIAVPVLDDGKDESCTFPGIGIMVVEERSDVEDATLVPCCLLSILPSSSICPLLTTHLLCSSFALRAILYFLSPCIGPAVVRFARRRREIALLRRIVICFSQSCQIKL